METQNITELDSQTDPFQIAGRTLSSRLILGTGEQPRLPPWKPRCKSPAPN